jgi:O-methyltransferase
MIIVKQILKIWRIVKGWFDNTLANYQFADEILILRLDGDWYDSTLCCLYNLFPKVRKGRIIIIDDYYTWEGCSKAVHDYLHSKNSSSQIRQWHNNVAYIVK